MDHKIQVSELDHGTNLEKHFERRWFDAPRSRATQRPPSRVSLQGEFMRRRNFLLLAGVGLTRLYASSSDFWNKKDPADWTGAEKDQLTNKSPWAKEIT
jgi:hypothetical protein